MTPMRVAIVVGVSLACLQALAAGSVARAAQPAIHIDPAPVVLDGNPLHISITGVAPGSEVTLTAERWFAPLSVQRPAPRLMRSEAVFVADDEGRVELQSTPSQRGSYRGIDPRGPFWSMQPVVGIERATPGSVDTAEVRFQLHVQGAVAGTGRVRLITAVPEVTTVAADPLPGAVFAMLPGTTKRPALIIIGGSEGGSLVTTAAAPFASHGFAVLALPVFSPPDRSGAREIAALPAEWADMPVEVLNRARDWLAKRPEVDATRIGLHGTSMGGVLVLLGAAHLDWPVAVVANVPSDIVWEGWGPGIESDTRSTFSLAGRPLPFVPLEGYNEETKNYDRGQPVIIRRPHERGRMLHAARVAGARVPVERIRIPIMVSGAFDDQMWPSGDMARNIAASRGAASLNTEALLYPEAGHLLYDTGYSPTTLYNTGLRKTGGTPEGNARAQAEVWIRTIAFLHRALGRPETRQ
jgi:dienelactone hydrolase